MLVGEKTGTIKRFENDLKKNGFRFKVVKELRDKTRYNITDGKYYIRNYETWNVLDVKANGFKLFKMYYDTFIKLVDMDSRENEYWEE